MTMRCEHPSRRWLKQFDVAFIKHGGHNGPQTLTVCRTQYAVPFYQAGATAVAAGLAAAIAYRLHSEVTELKEQVDGMLHDARFGRLVVERAYHMEEC